MRIKTVAQSGLQDIGNEKLNVSVDSESDVRQVFESSDRELPKSLLEMADPEFAEEIARQIGSKAVVSLIYRSENKKVDILSVYAKSPDRFTSREMNLLKEMSADLEFGLRSLEDRKERERVERALRESEQQKSAILDTMSELVVYQKPSGEIVWSNQAARESVGMAAEQMVGKRCYEVWHGRDERCPLCPVPAARRTGDSVSKEVETPDGRTWLISVDPLTDHSGAITGFVEVTSEITERKKAREELKRTNRRLQRAMEELQDAQQRMIQKERLQAIGEMASGVAHDFNNALTQILGFTELLLESPDTLRDTEKARRDLELIRSAALHASDVVRRMREFHHETEEHHVSEPVDITRVLKNAVSFTKPRWEDQAQAKGARIELRTDLKDVPMVSGNEVELQEVVTNLLVNAIDAMPGGGTIGVLTESDSDEVHLEVSDTGEGMSSEVQEHCFDPFFSTKSEHGSGMGLSIVKRVVKDHQGRVTIQSARGEGTTVRISLPLPKDAEQAGIMKEKSPEIDRSLRILVVEDSDQTREILSTFLRSDGHQVEMAADGEQALEYYENGNYDVVITDLAMPRMSGDQLVDEIRDMDDEIPVLMLTGFGHTMSVEGDAPEGVDCVIPKPVTRETLRNAVARAVSE
ncbi:MAG: ATP-binding protein [Candidatus Brocadiia bacterium]